MRRWGLVALVAAVALAGCHRAQAPTDGPVRRVITTTPSSTELVAAAGGLDRLVGVDQYSEYPPPVTSLPKVGDFLSPNLQVILRLRPDLVVMDETQEEVAAALSSAGVRTLTLPMHTIGDIRDGLGKVGDALGTADASARAIAAIDRAIEAVSDRRQRRTSSPSVLVVVDREPGALRGLVCAGPESFWDQLLGIVGAENAVREAPVRYPKISPEQVLRLQPDAILDASRVGKGHGGDVTDWNALASARAVAEGRVHWITDSVFGSPSPRVGDAVVHLETLLFGSTRPGAIDGGPSAALGQPAP